MIREGSIHRKVKEYLSKEIFVIWLMISLWFILLSVVAIMKYYNLRFGFTDHGIYYYLIENLRINNSFYDFSFDYIHRLGIHFSAILIFFVPVHYISNSPVTIVLIQAFIVALGAIGIYKIALFYFIDKKYRYVRMLFPLIYLVYAPQFKSTLYDFDISRIAPTFIIFFIYYTIIERNDLKSILFAILLIITRETLPLIVAGAGFSLLLMKGERLRGLLYLLSGIAFFLIINFILMPYFKTIGTDVFNREILPYLSSHYSYIQGVTLFEKFFFIISHPFDILKVFFTEPYFKMITFCGLFGLLLFMPLLNIRIVMIPFFIAGIYFLSSSKAIFQYNHQYFSEIYPAIFVAAIAGFRCFADRFDKTFFTGKRILLSILLLNSLFAVHALGYHIEKIYQVHSLFGNEVKVILSDPLNLKNEKDIILFVHPKLFPYFGWHKYMTPFQNFEVVYPVYKKDKSIKAAYLVTINEPILGDWLMEPFMKIQPILVEKGFKVVYRYNNFFIYKKDL